MPLLLPNGAQSASDTIATHFLLPENLETADLVILTQQGRIKRLPASELASLTARGLTLIKLKDSDRLAYVNLTKERQEVVLATSGGRVLRFQVNDQQLPIMGRTAQGVQASRFRVQEKLIGSLAVAPGDNILLVSQLGYAKRLPVSALRLVNLGEIGTQMFQFTSKADGLVGMVSATASSQVVLLTTQRVVRVAVNSVKFWGKDGTGDRIVQLNPEEKIINVVPSH